MQGPGVAIELIPLFRLFAIEASYIAKSRNL
jgi:hypothetical protein